MRRLTAENIKVGLRVIDWDQDEGTIERIEIKDGSLVFIVKYDPSSTVTTPLNPIDFNVSGLRTGAFDFMIMLDPIDELIECLSDL